MDNSIVYDKVRKVCFQKDNMSAELNYIEEFEDYCDQITIKSVVKIDSVYRGWLGDITYWADDGVDVKDYDKVNLTSDPCCVKDALCARVNVMNDSEAPVRWEYVFLKY